MTKVSITEAAKLTGISKSTLYYRYIKTGLLNAEFIDGVRRIELADLVKLITLHGQEDAPVELHQPQINHERLVTLLRQQLSEANQREKLLIAQIERLISIQQTLVNQYATNSTDNLIAQDLQNANG